MIAVYIESEQVQLRSWQLRNTMSSFNGCDISFLRQLKDYNKINHKNEEVSIYPLVGFKPVHCYYVRNYKTEGCRLEM